ncbi:MAG: hypothetical protein J6129_01240 [Bacteroidaceae bacterium]|nr:hypothetical protein [Bacteroidaceae bacterium]
MANYTPPRNVQIMERDLASLVSLLPQADASYTEHAPVWGWDLSLVRKLKAATVCSPSALPTTAQLADIRRLSSRLTAVEMLPAVRARLPEGTTVGESSFVTDIAEVKKQRSIFKTPYSGSGRGLRVVEAGNFASEMPKLESMFNAQGGIVVEPYYDKVADFALEYLVTPSEVQFLGLSVFETNANNAYLGNRIALQSVLWQRMSQLVPQFDFEQLIEAVCEELRGRFVGHYLGPPGVDMMVVREEGELKVHPCVEVNVRRTMGELSLHMLPLMAEGTEGFFRIIYDKDTASLRRAVDAMPAAVYDGCGKLTGGTKILTPLNADTHYVALIEVARNKASV